MSDLTTDEKKHELRIMTASIFSAYIGEKNPDDLIAHPEKIEADDYEHISLPFNEIKITKSIINKLLND